MSDADDGPLARRKEPLRYVMGATYVIAGVMHFVAPRTFARAVPSGLPRPRALVLLSGLAEIGLGLGVAIRRTQRASAWGLVALLVAVFPANVHMATDGLVTDAVPDRFAGIARLAAWARLPFQGALVLWAWWYTSPDPADTE